MSVFGTIKYTNTDIFLLFFNIIIGVEDMGITLQNKTNGEKKELENAKKVMLPW